MISEELQSADGLYEKVREQVRSENELYNHRIIWLISMQAFLFATMGILLGGASDASVKSFGLTFLGGFVLVCITGILVAAVSNRVLANARNALSSLGKQWDKFESTLTPETRVLLPHPRGRDQGGKRDTIIGRGFGSGNLPFFFGLVWALLLAVFLIDYFSIVEI